MSKENQIDESTIVSLFHDPQFLSQFEKVNTEREIIKIFNQNNVPITSNNLEALHNICEKYIDRGVEIIDEESFLENIAAAKLGDSNNMTVKKIINILSEFQDNTKF